MAKCKQLACGMPIAFVHLETTGRHMPVDPVPDEDGTVSARLVEGQLTGRVLTRGEDDPQGWLRYMPHPATCAARSRGRKGKRRPTPPPTLFDTTTTEGNHP